MAGLLRFGAMAAQRMSRSWTITERIETKMTKTIKKLEPIPPGEILAEEFMAPHAVSQNRLARDIDVNPARINDIVHGRSAITASIALRLAKYFGTTPRLWLNLQSDYDLRRARDGDWPKIEPRVRVLSQQG
jgi:addiction module HigA family antidote